MKLKNASVSSMLALLLPRAWAAADDAGNGNLTVAFFPESQGDACNANDISKAITLTTESVPTGFTCLNVSDIFSQHNTTGFQNATSNIYSGDDGSILQPNGVSWLLQNLDLYDKNANYSHVWYAQANESRVEEGKPAPWVFYTYAFPDCRQIAEGDPEPGQDPWFETSCQTDKDGQCRTNPDPIVSFGINTAKHYRPRGSCEAWVKQGGGAGVGDGVGKLALKAAVVAAALLITL